MIESPPESHDLTATEAPEAPQDPGRREFVVGAAAATTGLALFARAAQAADGAVQAAPAVPASAPAPASPFAAYVEIREDGTVQIVCPQAEIGQGVHDSLARIVADELDADWPTVRVVQPHADAGFASPINRRQRVGGSDSIMAYRDPLRVIGATARAMLVGAAAARWGVAPQDCSTEAGRVRHVASDRSLGFGELGGARGCRGSGATGPGMVHAALRRSTSFGGRLLRFDAASIASRPGIVAVVPLDDAVAVVADSWWRARQATEALEVEFDETGLRGLSSAGVAASQRRCIARSTTMHGPPNGRRSTTPARRRSACRRIVTPWRAPSRAPTCAASTRPTKCPTSRT